MKLLKLSYKYIIIFSLVLLFLFHISKIFAKDMTPEGLLHGRVRVNICGDGVAEENEECDLTDIKSQTCNSFGYDYGVLSCKMTCELNKGNCHMNQNEPEEEQEEEVIETPTQEQYPSAVAFLSLFDENGDGVIQANEIPLTIVTWVNHWKTGSGADLNDDGETNVYDFSLLMYYLNIPS